MNTQSHILMGALLFGKPVPRLAWAGAAGGLLPDLPMYAIVGTFVAAGYPIKVIFDTFYWERWWQIANGLAHSPFVWGALSIGALATIVRRDRRHVPLRTSPGAGVASVILAVSLSALLHSAIDFLVHRADAHMQFWPVTDWRFRSPVSYWDADFYGVWFGLFEAGLGVAMAAMLFRRYRSPPLRLALLLAVVLYVAVPVFFYFRHHGAT